MTHEPDPRAFEDTAARDTGGLLALGLHGPRLDADALAAALPQYDQFAPIGGGGMGVVWRARQIQLDRTVAIKLLRPELAGDPSFAERFAREARALARLQHPGIVGVHDYGEALGMFYLVMEHVDGTDLRSLLDGALTSEQALAIVPQLCDALQYAHEEGVVHRDIKPENILVDRRGRVRIADFGLAKLRDASGSRATSSGRVLGTAHYMAPEQIDRPAEVDHRADIFALGVVIYEMLTGKLPLGRFEVPSRLRKLDVRLDEVVMKTLEHDRDRRYQHVSEVKDHVVALGPAPDRVRPEPDEVERSVAAERKKALRRPGLFGMVLVASLVNNCWIHVDDGFSVGSTAGHRFGPRFPVWVLLAGVCWGFARTGWLAWRHRGTPRGHVMEAKLCLGFVLASLALGGYALVRSLQLETISSNPFVNGLAWFVFAFGMSYVVWTQASERGVPLRIVFGPTWWIPRWEAELEPRGRSRTKS